MSDSKTDANAPVVGTTAEGKYLQFGSHIDTLETVDLVFNEQRKLSFTYGAIFFVVTLAIPALSVWAPGWYANENAIWGGFTWNYLFVALIYFVFLWTMAWTYSKQADRLDEKLMHIAEEIEAKAKAGGVS